jgi:hypothetical protein
LDAVSEWIRVENEKRMAEAEALKARLHDSHLCSFTVHEKDRFYFSNVTAVFAFLQ